MTGNIFHSSARSSIQPGRQIAYGLAVLIVIALIFAPFIFPDVRSQQVAARICIFIVLVASYDLLLGYAGIVSFAHTMFFGLGAYGTAIALTQMGRGWDAVFFGALAGVGFAAVLAAIIGLLSLRVKAIFFAMVTLAAAAVMMVLTSQLSGFTGGEDGIIYQVPKVFSASTKLLVDDNGSVVRLLGVKLNGKLFAYYFVLISCMLLFLMMMRIVASPFGSVLQAIRENELRTEAIGYRVVAYRTAAFVLSAVIAALAGVLWALWLKYVGPDTTLSLAIMIDVLLMVVIGGMGTLVGAIVGATLLGLAQFYLKDLMAVASQATVDIPLLSHLLAPERWMLWLGIIFILLVYFFPAGIVGTLIGKHKH